MSWKYRLLMWNHCSIGSSATSAYTRNCPVEFYLQMIIYAVGHTIPYENTWTSAILPWFIPIIIFFLPFDGFISQPVKKQPFFSHIVFVKVLEPKCGLIYLKETIKSSLYSEQSKLILNSRLGFHTRQYEFPIHWLLVLQNVDPEETCSCTDDKTINWNFQIPFGRSIHPVDFTPAMDLLDLWYTGWT